VQVDFYKPLLITESRLPIALTKNASTDNFDTARVLGQGYFITATMFRVATRQRF